MTMIGHVQVAPCAVPRQMVVDGDHDVGLVPAHRGGDVAPQREAVLDEAVRMVEELDAGHADEGRARAFLRLAEPSALRGFDRVDPGLTPRHQQVRDRLALFGPAGHRTCGAVFEVVGVRDHGQRAFPILRYALQGHAARLSSANE
jgi:hypothetical protein